MLSVAIKGDMVGEEKMWMAGEGNVQRGGEGSGRRACRRDSSPLVLLELAQRDGRQWFELIREGSRGRMHDTVVSTSPRLNSTYAWTSH